MKNLLEAIYQLSDWSFGKITSSRDCDDLYMSSKNGLMLCRIICPKKMYKPTFEVFLTMSDGFNGEWLNSNIRKRFCSFKQVIDFLEWIETNSDLSRFHDETYECFKSPSF